MLRPHWSVFFYALFYIRPLNFRNQNVTAPLKRVGPSGMTVVLLYFRNQNVTAPLKQFCTVKAICQTCYFRNQNVTAPLKQKLADYFNEMLLNFRNQNVTAPLKPGLHLSGLHLSGYFRNQNVTAPLKLINDNRGSPTSFISVTKMLRPHWSCHCIRVLPSHR